ncbi:prepilin-type N-terminal cleavage/methylation domain-containing protein [PVC group bacterium]|nr:prepilin-type N-terminal cleavage/methylation domain-containing protein [PVC group bacterium]
MIQHENRIWFKGLRSAGVRVFRDLRRSAAFTLLEVMMAIGIMAIITGTIFFALTTGLDSWAYSKNQLALQKVLSDVVEMITNGAPHQNGVKDGLEILEASRERLVFVSPWTDDTHTVVRDEYTYILDRKIKPGAAPPVVMIRYPGSDETEFSNVQVTHATKYALSEVMIGTKAPLGSQLYFTYHPDSKTNPDVIETLWWDKKEKQIYLEDINGVENLSKNPFGVVISEFRMTYFDNKNELVSDRDWLDPDDRNFVTGIEIYLEAELEEYKLTLLTFINLRNAPMSLGYTVLEKGTRIKIPDSTRIHTFQLTNFSGVDQDDVLELLATSDQSGEWLIKIMFENSQITPPKISRFEIEYPEGNVVYTATPKSDIAIGLDMLLLDVESLFDYDDDPDIEDVVMMTGEVVFEVKEMDIEGAGLFVRP